MLPSRRPLEPRILQSSTTRPRVLSQSRTGHSPPSPLLSSHRKFFWGSKTKYTTSRAWKVCKGFSAQENAGQDLTRKQLYRSVFWSNYHFRRYLPRYAPIQELRFSSSLGKKPESILDSRNKADVNEIEEENWYTRWEKQKLRQYDDFVKEVEHDPYTALFGKNWLNFAEENIEPRAATTSSPDLSKETSVPKVRKNPENWPSQSKSSSTKTSEDRDISGGSSISETMPIKENDQVYEIDPITNRKVLKASASPLATFGRNNPQAEDGDRAFEPFSKLWSLLSSRPLDRRFLMAEHVEVLSSSDSPNRNTPSLKPHSSDGWLAQEGFQDFQKPKAKPQPNLQTRDAKPNTTATKVESALDRHLSNKSTNEKRASDHKKLQYKYEENKTEDIDLLRPSDVRASAGLHGTSPKETDADKQARRKKLEEKYESCSPDRASQLAGEVASKKVLQKIEDRPVKKNTAPELRFGSWLEGTLKDANPTSKEASKSTSAAWVNKISDARDSDPVSVHQTPNLTPQVKNESVSQTPSAIALEAPTEAKDKASKLKAQIVPFKAKLDAMKADYDFLRQQWLQETRIMRMRAAKKEEQMKAQEIAKRAREMHEEEIKTQKVAMEAMEMRKGDRNTNTIKNASANGMGNDGTEKSAPRRLQSFLQGEGDMASNVHEFAGRDRWYKRKAPHAMDAKDAEIDAKLQKLATDRALICEIRSIYEDTYGTIDTKHRQSHALSGPPTGSPDQPIISSSGTAASHTQLPSNAAGKTESLKGLDESQISVILVIIQKLFGQLREAQSIIQDYQCQTKQAFDPNNQDTTSNAIEKNMMQISITASRLAGIGRVGMINRGPTKATATSNSEIPLVNRLPPTAASESTNLEVKNTKELKTYCILAYDSNTKSIKSVESTTLAPFSKEESLLPSDALARLSNPGKFLCHAISLVEKGYKPVSGTNNILVFKKDITTQDVAKTKKPDARKEPNPTHSSLDHSWVVPEGSLGTQGGIRPFKPPIKADIQKYHQTQSRGIEGGQQKIQEGQKQAAEKMGREEQEVEKCSKTAMGGIRKEKQGFEQAEKQQSAASSAWPSQTCSDTVRRQERVFSGARQGRWVYNSVKFKRSSRAARKRRRTIKSVLMAGGITAACCYCVGVASEMMHGR